VSANTFKVIAIELPRIRVSNHGVHLERGGEVVAVEEFDDQVPYYMACEIVEEAYPGCHASVVRFPGGRGRA
jgi:hypothetical protein